jgi:hypothetical protein
MNSRRRSSGHLRPAQALRRALISHRRKLTRGLCAPASPGSTELPLLIAVRVDASVSTASSHTPARGTRAGVRSGRSLADCRIRNKQKRRDADWSRSRSVDRAAAERCRPLATGLRQRDGARCCRQPLGRERRSRAGASRSSCGAESAPRSRLAPGASCVRSSPLYVHGMCASASGGSRTRVHTATRRSAMNRRDGVETRRRVRVKRGVYRQPNSKYAVCFMLDGKPRFRTVEDDLDTARSGRARLAIAAQRACCPPARD